MGADEIATPFIGSWLRADTYDYSGSANHMLIIINLCVFHNIMGNFALWESTQVTYSQSIILIT